MSRPKVEEFRRRADAKLVEKVQSASRLRTRLRDEGMGRRFADLPAARAYAAAVKDWTLDNLADCLAQFETAAHASGCSVHWARDSEEACRVIADICGSSGTTIVKGKSMATEEIGLNHALAGSGHRVVETDLGEFIAQIDDDTPSHIVTPIIHKDRHDAARAMRAHGIALEGTEPTAIAAAARAHLRSVFREAKVGISGVNFGIAETGRMVIVENEGNNRLSTTTPPVHIAVMGIERILPREADLPVFLALLAGSATGQAMTVYTHLVSGPRAAGEVDGPEEVHVVLLDNGRSRVHGGPYRSILRCLRCGACLNVCPVYREVSGHAYRNVYPGPLGAVLAPAMFGLEAYADLPFASTLCGACKDVCPVDIPIPDLLLQLRHEARSRGLVSHGPNWKAWAALATNDRRWKVALKFMPLAARLPSPWTATHGKGENHQGGSS